MSAPAPDDLARALAAHAPRELPPLPGRTNHLRAGVLVPVRWAAAGPEAILTLRPDRLRRHGGEVSFPGGKPEPGDEDLEATALREAHEELGIEGARVLGRLSSMPLYTSDYRLVPFVAVVEQERLVPDPAEVARVLTRPLEPILEGPRIEAIPYALGGRTHLSPVFRLEGCVVFGATAHTLLELLEVAAPCFGRTVPPLEPGDLGWADLLGGSEAG